ncbi:MAG: hypothetical protein GY771_12095 [bacterium]|nr:hypothetical protein [bacterium]
MGGLAATLDVVMTLTRFIYGDIIRAVPFEFDMKTESLNNLAAEIDDELRRNGRYDADTLKRYYAAAQEAFDAGDTEAVFEVVRLHLGRFEEALSSIGCFAEADKVYARKMELHRQFSVYRRKTGGGFKHTYRAFGYSLWRLTSNYGISPLRILWTAGNVVLVFSFVYFFLDVISFYNSGRLAFIDGTILKPISYFIVGVQGLFPGTAFHLGTIVETQIAITLENLLGGILILLLFASLKRRLFRGEV